MRAATCRSLGLALATLALVATAAGPAAAEDTSPRSLEAAVAAAEQPPDAPPAPTKWYGWQTLAADAAALTLFGGAVATGKDHYAPLGFLVLGTGTYALGAPIVHLSQGEVGRGVASLGMRIALPSLIGLMANQVSRGCEDRNSWMPDFCREGRTAIGILVGSVIAMTVDSAALAWKQAPKPVAEPNVTPSLDVSANGAKVGLQGRF